MAVVTKRVGSIEYLAAESICVPHGFTTRHGGVSTGVLASLNLGMHRGDDAENVQENFRRLTSALNIPLEQLVMTWQVHGDMVRKVGKADANGIDHRKYPQCDGLITNEPGVALWVFTADCTPVLLHDPVTGAVGAVHAGWRGTALGIAGKAVREMVAAYGCKAEDIRAAIGPNIGVCCFETHRDVPDAMIAALGDEANPHIHSHGDKYYVNLKELNALWLRKAGVQHIEISTDCTACQTHRFWSHRMVGDARGSQGAIIQCKEANV